MNLIDVLTNSPTPTRDLSYLIAQALGWQRDDGRSFVWRSPKGEAHHVPPDYARDISALLTHLPDGYQFTLSDRAPKPHAGRAYIHNGEMQFEGGGMTRNPRYRGWERTAYTPPLALAAVILLANGYTETTDAT